MMMKMMMMMVVVVVVVVVLLLLVVDLPYTVHTSNSRDDLLCLQLHTGGSPYIVRESNPF